MKSAATNMKNTRARVTLCPCCGASFEGDLADGCARCGARRVGPPLAPPERVLPAYGHSLFIAAVSLLLASAFIAYTVDALLHRETLSLDFGAIAGAAQTAAWRMKLTLLPASLLCFWITTRLRARMRRTPSLFAGHAHARAGLALTACVALALAALVITNVPEQLRRRELARRAADESVLYATDRVLYAYRARFGTYPAAPSDLKRLPDDDGSVARVVALLEQGTYAPEAEVAALDAKTRRRRGTSARLRNASVKTDAPGAGIVLTSYEVVLPGRDKVLGTDDDLRIGDGRLLLPGESARRPTPTPF